MCSKKLEILKNKFSKNQDYIERQISLLEDIEALQLENREKLTLSYQLGSAIFQGMKSFSNFIALPRELIAVNKEAKRRKMRKQKLFSKKSTSKPIQKPKPIVAQSQAIKIEFPANQTIKQLRVACICDEFTYSSFKEEYNMLQLDYNHWKNELQDFKPDFIFIESAWKGKNDEWTTVISNFKEELQKLFSFAKLQKTPICFWNKEDPVHFDSFIEIAQHADFIFTTDIDCIPKYKNFVGHNQVYLLPFAAQSKHHNPIEKYTRLNKACFAGSYYLRYPQRQKDFSEIMLGVQDEFGVDIYDRNYGKEHPHYAFPDSYKPYIIGSLPFEKIDKAYKGYEYGINMNTIKQSQTMFARRVFELVASNTIVISNFSRGVRNFFGDYIIASDSRQEISQKLREINSDILEKDKHKLNAMRYVLSKHTYKQRAEFIASKLFENIPSVRPVVSVFTKTDTVEETKTIIHNFLSQHYKEKKLFILTQINIIDELNSLQQNIHFYTDINEFYCNIIENTDYCAYFSSDDYYASDYIGDLVLATTYTSSNIITKDKYYSYNSIENNINEGKSYSFVKQYIPRKSLMKANFLHKEKFSNILTDTKITLENTDVFSIDYLNYCFNGNILSREKKQHISTDDKVKIINLDAVNNLKITPDSVSHYYTDHLVKIDAKNLYEIVTKPASSKIMISFEGKKLRVVSRLEKEKHAYIYFNKKYERSDINMLFNSSFIFNGNNTITEVKTVAVFYDKDGEKISHAMNNRLNVKHQLAIPVDCATIQFGLRIVGSGNLFLKDISIGNAVSLPQVFLGRSDILCVAKQYPSYDDIYKYGFLHTRLKAYKKHGLAVDMFKVSQDLSIPFAEFEDIDIATANHEMLDRMLASGQYKHILVHLIDHHIWSVLEKYIETTKVTIWVHGAEAQAWQRRAYEFGNLTESEIARKKKLSDHRISFWNKLLEKDHKNLKLIFVSNNFKQECEEDFNYQIKSHNYEIINNPVDTHIFNYVPKTPEQRLKFLSIRPYASEKYANDLTVKTILLLKDKPYFNQLEFSLFGDGELFESITQPLQGFTNVNLHRRFLQHTEIAQQHKKHGIFLTPTRMDAQGVSRDEAMSSGLVPITTRVAAVPEFVHEKIGFLADPESAEQMAEAVDILYHDPELFLQMSRDASEHVQKTLNVENITEQEIKEIKRYLDEQQENRS